MLLFTLILGTKLIINSYIELNQQTIFYLILFYLVIAFLVWVFISFLFKRTEPALADSKNM